MLADFVYGHDPRMIQAGHNRRFIAESLQIVRGSQLAGPQHFECYDAIEALLASLVNYTHPTAANLLQYLVIADRTTFRG